METEPRSAPAAGGRILYMDLLRIVASLGVISVHVMAENGLFIPFFDAARFYCLPIFFMLSGALLLDPARELSFRRLFTHNIPHILIAYLVWSVAYAFVRGWQFGYSEGMPKILTFGMRVLDGPHHFWFINALLAQYLMAPIYRMFTAKRRMTEYFLLLWAVFGILGTMMLESELAPLAVETAYYEMELQFILGFGGYFILGHYLSSYELPKGVRYAVYALALLCCAAAFAMRALGCPMTEKWWSNYSSLHCLFSAAAVFLLFRQLFTGEKCPARLRSFISLLGKCSFGAYIVHVFIINLIIGGLGFTAGPLSAALYVPLATLIVSVLSYLVAILLSRIPIVRKYLI